MCGEPGEELCDKCFAEMREGSESWPCKECEDRLSRICGWCGIEQEEAILDENGEPTICDDCKNELPGYEEVIQ